MAAADSRFAATGKLPLFALATAPKAASKITSIKDLEGKTVGVSGLGNADHALTLYLLKQAGADASEGAIRHHGRQPARGIAPGPDRCRAGAGAGADPDAALGARVLVNAMDLETPSNISAAPYEFMGVAVRAERSSSAGRK